MERVVSFGPLTSISLRNLDQNQLDVENHFRRLASGLRIERAGDDSAGLSISERMRARLASQDVAQRNLQDGVSLLRTAESSLAEMSDILGRMRELSLAALNGTASDDDVRALQSEFTALAHEIRRQVRTTEFNGIDLLRADRQVRLQAGPDRDDTIDVNLVNMSAIGIVLQILNLRSEADRTLETVDGYVDLVSAVRGQYGAQENRLASSLRSLATDRNILTGAESRIRDLDVGRETADLAGAEIRRDAGLTLLSRAQFEPARILDLIESSRQVLDPGPIEGKADPTEEDPQDSD